ncbi:hypothetical protein K7X08_034891 [Anisodus acutangulus]|uniref:Uncharacterized protein n=1 Tax=Anisodus acutangulus TaxID=402998 RepID=A0A9Q1R032_9SOLA|nr:hypothetical protein K7X08_034891 [Anisodus acutangulus]
MENFDHRFQRTDQWMPVYSWLETLDTDEVVKSKEIIDWLTENPDVREQLNSRHSRYHLMHYIKKCHMKILKRKEKKGPEFTKNMSLSEVQESEVVKKSVPLQTADYNLSTIPKDSEIYKAKQTEALHKYEILVELEKQLSMHLPKPENIGKHGQHVE